MDPLQELHQKEDMTKLLSCSWGRVQTLIQLDGIELLYDAQSDSWDSTDSEISERSSVN